MLIIQRGINLLITPDSNAECVLFFSGSLDTFKRYTPIKMIENPQRRETVFVASVVLNPWKRIAEATMVEVVKNTK